MTDLRDPAHHVSPRARWMWLVTTAVQGMVAVVVVGVVAVLWIPTPWRWLAMAATLACAVAALVAVPRWRYLVHRWEASTTAVYTQRGWWSRERRIAPMSRVQTVDFEQGPLARFFGLASVTVTTASAAGPLRIDGLDAPVALRLVEELTRKADLAEGDAT
ncbi:PH domain-containing protein [Nocardioides sp. YIM 152588]|uniref:PH domain-containing protein n=1 Tax=Nocardioides sp. YIM 152588 TaxID=3158259 RepID=UPI0032E43513